MQLSFSHIAWPPEKEAEALGFLKNLGVTRLEVAPLRAFGDPLTATESAVREKADWYRGHGFSIGSFQALLFGTEGLELFGSEESRRRLKETLMGLGRVAGWAGAGPMVFGSPKNRLRGGLDHEAAIRTAAPFFREIGDACAEAGSCLVIEANPVDYGADFCNTLAEAARLVEEVDSAGFGLHLDAGGMALGADDFEDALSHAARHLKHVHASQPHLVSFASPDPIHQRIARALAGIGYDSDVAIEMRGQPDGLDAVAVAVETVRAIYGTTC